MYTWKRQFWSEIVTNSLYYLSLRNFYSHNFLRIFPFSRLRQQAYGGCGQSTDVVYSSTAPDPTVHVCLPLFCILSLDFVLNADRYHHISFISPVITLKNLLNKKRKWYGCTSIQYTCIVLHNSKYAIYEYAIVKMNIKYKKHKRYMIVEFRKADLAGHCFCPPKNNLL